MATKNIGFVVELIGDAQVRSVDGVIRVLNIGDQIHEGDILTTGLGTEIVLEFYDGNNLQIGENTEILLDESVFAGLNAYPDDRADQLAELQNLIVEGVDLAELEATAAGAASDSDALHQASIYSRVGDEGNVETRVTPFNLGASDLDDQSLLDGNAVQIPADSANAVASQSSGAMPTPAAFITVDSITSDDVINAVEAGSPINVTGTVGGDAMPGDTVSFNINSAPYSGTVDAGNAFSISVAAADLVADNSFDATVSGTDIDGNPYSATTTSTHTVDTTATATITLDPNITPDDIVDAIEAGGIITITGTVAGDFQAGDIVTLSINGINTTGAVLANGSFSIDVNGSDLRNDPDMTIDASFVATDAAGNIAAPVIDTESYAVNNAPSAFNDVGALDGAEDSTTASLNTTMLSNDSDLDGDAVNITAINGTALIGGVQSIAVVNGTVNIDAGDNITFTPDANYNGPVSFNYTLSDGSLTDTATVSGTVTDVNDAPVAVVDSASVAEDGSVDVDVIANDTDLDGTINPASVVITTGPSNGSVSVNATTGVVTYTPNANYFGPDSFSYTVEDDDGQVSNIAAVSLTVTDVNDAPVAAVDSATVAEDGSVDVDVIANDTDLDGTINPASVVITSGPSNGSVSVNATTGVVTYTPNANYFGPDSFSYTVEDDDGQVSNIAAVNLTVTDVNDAPVIDLDNNDSSATGSNYAVTFTEGGSAAYIADIDINITDVDNTSLVGATITVNSVESGDLLTVGSMPAGITASAYDSVTGIITLSGSASFSDYQDAIRAIQFSNDGSTTNTTRSIDVVVTDGMNNSNIATTDVTINTLPTVTVADVSVQEPAAGTIDLIFTISIDQTLGSNLTFDYETADISALAGADFVGISSTVGTITAGNTSTTVTVTVNSDANVFEGDETLALNLTNFNQTVNFDTAAHIIGGGVQGIGTIGANNGAPDAVDDSYITTVDTPLVITNALANDTLVDNAAVDVTGYTDLGSGIYGFNGNNGTVEYDSNTGEFTFTPTGGYTGTADFSYTLIDDDGETDTATVSVDVSSVVVNPPVVSNVPDTAYTENDSPISLISGVNITDVDSTNLSSVVVTIDGYIGSQDVLDYLTAGTSVVASVAVSGSTWELTLTGGVDINEYETVLDSITYQNSSDNPSTSVRNITIEAFDQSYANLFGSDAGTLSITAINDAPDVFDNNVFALDNSSDNALNITVPTDPDTDDNLLVITITGLPASVGTVTLSDGTPVSVGNTLTLTQLSELQFDAGPMPGQDTLTYDVFDGSLTTSATTTVNVGSTEADIGTAYESALSNGTGVGAGSDTVTGNLFANDAASTPTSTIDDVNGTTPTGGVITINTAIGTLTVYADNTTPGFSAGDYVYVLNTADGTSNDVDEVFTYTFTEGVALSDTLTISVIDDAPVANNVVQNVPESEEQVFNIIFTLDDSGSMAWGALTGDTSPPPTEPTRMDIAKESLAALGAEYFNQSTQVEITLVTFNSAASFVGTYDNFAAFEAALNGVTPGGGTNYVDATDEIQNQLAADLAVQDPADDIQNISYFISDGEANSGTSPIGSGYIEFVNDNSVDSYSVGIGSSLPGDLSDLNYIHNIDSLGQGGGAVDDALIVTDVSQLESELLSTVPTAFGGNITANGSVSNVLFGADGGYVQSFTTDLGGTDYTFSYDGSTVNVPAALAATVVVNGSTIELGTNDGFAYGTFTFNFADGAYTLSAPNGLAPSVFDFDYTILDGDGDTASATATINIIDDAPDARDDLHSLNAFEVAAGNVITALGTDGGPQFGSNLSPFTTQGGGVDKIVDNAVVTEFTYKGATISIDSADLSGTVLPDPVGTSENIEVDSAAKVGASNFSISGFSGGSPASLGFDNSGGDQGVGVGNDRLDNGESLLINFDSAALPYGIENLNLTMNQFGGSEAVDITVFDVDDVTVLGSFTHSASSGSIINLSAFNGIGSVQIANNSGGNSTLRYVDYDPTPAPVVSGSNGGDLTWIYNVETDLDGNDIYQATVTDSNDGSVFIMRSNGFYQHTPDQTGVPTPITESFLDGSADNGISLASPDATPNFNSTTGVGMNSSFDTYNTTVDTGEEITISFDSVQHPFGVKEVSLTNYWASGNATISVFDTGGLLLESYATAINGSMDIALQSSGIGSIRIETDTSSSDYISIQSVDFTPLVDPASISTEQAPILVDYVLTDSDGQSDSAQLALYTIDQTITGTSGIDNIAGGSLNDAIIGDEGDDILSGNAGHDSLSGGAGNDTLSGGIGDDYLSGGDGQDSLSGGAGSDTLDGGAGDDVVDGSSGDDVVLGGQGDDQVFGGSGDDRLEGGAGDDVLTGGSGDDIIFGDAGDDRINGGSGNDSLVGGDGIDIFALESGDEGTIAAPAVDTIADFTPGVGGDVLDLSDMLQGEESAPLDGFLNFSYDTVSGDTTISIDVDGSSGTEQQIVLSGVDLTANGTLTDSQILDSLLNNGNLIVDQ